MTDKIVSFLVSLVADKYFEEKIGGIATATKKFKNRIELKRAFNDFCLDSRWTDKFENQGCSSGLDFLAVNEELKRTIVNESYAYFQNPDLESRKRAKSKQMKKICDVANIKNAGQKHELEYFLEAVYLMILSFWWETLDNESKLAAGIAMETTAAEIKKLDEKQMKIVDEIRKEIIKEIEQVNASVSSLSVKNKHNDVSHIIDEKITENVETLRKSRFYNEFDIAKASLELARKLIAGDLSHGGVETISRAIAWCSRFISLTDLGKAEEYLESAKLLGKCQEVVIAEAFISSQKGDMQNALSILANINTPLSRTASIMIIANHEGVQSTVDWLETVGLKGEDLDSDGRYFLVSLHLQLEHWNDALLCLEAISDDDRCLTPANNQIVAITHLISTVPEELRTMVLNKVPFNAPTFPLAASTTAIEARRKSSLFFHAAAEAATKLHCSDSAKIFEEFEIWLELMDSSRSEQAFERLKDKLRDPKSALFLVGLALEFKIELDFGYVEKEIDRQIAFHGGITRDAAMARFALAFSHNTPDDVAKYFVKYREQFAKYLDNRYLQFLEIEMLSKAGKTDKAKECLEILIKEGLSGDEESSIKRIISEAEGINPIDTYKERFRKTDSLQDLVILANELQERDEWTDLCEYGEILFERTRSIFYAERLTLILYRSQKFGRLVDFVRENSEFLEQSKKLHLFFCWGLYFEGALVEARTELFKIYNDDNANCRELLVNIGIVSGDWKSLTTYIAKEYNAMDKRSAQEILRVAQLAHFVASPYAKELTFAAAEKGNDDPNVLSNAYIFATNAGWEDSKEVFQWLITAAKISDDSGPIQKKTLQDIINMKPDWDRREQETMQMLKSGDVPMFVAGDSLNRSLIHMMLFPALANRTEKDSRKRVNVPAFSGKQQSNPLTSLGAVSVDATALISLSMLKLLDRALDAFETVVLPHSTLKWLLEEKQKVSFHQPSQIRKAHQLHQLLANGVLEKFIPSTIPDSDLSAQVGDELAILIAEAKRNCEGNTQCVVVCPYPVHRIGSLMEEEADLTQYSTILCSCQAIVDKLRSKGQITVEEEKKAHEYLLINEKPWPNQPIISDKATLYLNDLSIYYLQHLGLLEKLKDAGFRSVVSPRELSKTNILISYENISTQIIDIIEQIRSAVNLRLESGKIIIGSAHISDELAERSIITQLSFELIAIAKNCEAVIVDDRFLNQYTNMSEGNGRAEIFTTLDLLDMLASNGSISTNELYDYRTLLRRAGYIFVPICDLELEQYLDATKVKDNQIIETTELKAIRENILCIRMSNWLQLPKESPWLIELFKTLIRVLKSVWTNEPDFSNIQARSKWILDLLDIRGWANCFSMSIDKNIVQSLQIEHIMLLYLPLTNAPSEKNAEYFNWLEEMVLAPIKVGFPDMYFELIERYRRQFEFVLGIDLPKGGRYGKKVNIRAIKIQVALRTLPPLIRESLFEDAQFIEKYELAIDSVISFDELGLTFDRSTFYNAVRKCLSGVPNIDLLDKRGNKCELNSTGEDGKLPIIELSYGDQHFYLPNFAMATLDSTMRLRYLELNALNVNLPLIEKKIWQDILMQRSLKDDEVDAFYHEYNQTPIKQSESIRREILEGHITIPSLVPTSQKYFERLIGVYDGSISISDYAVGSGKEFFEHLSSWNPYDGFLLSLYLSSHSALTAEINVNQLGSEDIVRAFEFIEKKGDRISQLGAIEVGLRVVSSKPEVEPIIIRLIEQLRDDDDKAEDSKINLITSLFILVDGELSRIHLFSNKPPFYRRLAALSQAALICRQIENSNADIGQFYKWAVNARGEQYYYQTLADMRVEPCWNPDLAAASQFKADFLGRIVITANKYEKSIKNGKLYNLILGTNPSSICALCEMPNSYFPGPLEGAVETLNILPVEVLKAIESQLQADEISPKSFIALVNSAMIFRIGTDQAELATNVLILANHRLANVEDRSQLLAILNGLATVAAITRSHALADELRILVRIYRCDPQYALSIDEVMRICLVAASSKKDLKAWRDFTGEWLTELAFCDYGDKDGKVFHSHLTCLCNAVPELWATCGGADAAIVAYIAQ